ncbi:MAG: 4-hydroxythreonine-4-phosphate dehydrogenase PdxA [Gemmatimonadota bacterium]
MGPEVAIAAVDALRDEPGRPRVVLVGPPGLGADGAGDDFVRIQGWRSGEDIERAGAVAGRAIERAARLALDGRVDGIVTAPIDKAALHAGGYRYPGHTEMLADLAGAPGATMMLAAESTAVGGTLRVVLVTTHLPLARVPETLTTALLVDRGRTTAAALAAGWSIERPRLALCALNPHASDGGLFGDEEARILSPARDRLRADGIRVQGPIPADTVFHRAVHGEFDAVLVPYHDVGMAVFKTVAFGRGVNVTLGLPFVRTSPDHGTAFDIAGTGSADPGSMAAALRLAARLALARRRADSHAPRP